MQMNNASKLNRIFGGQQKMDIYQNQGRNVPPFTMQKKPSQQGSQKVIQSPFDGYLSSQNNLARSQVSDLNLQLTKRLVKQQLSRYGGIDQSKIRNDVDIMKTEIRTLKQYVSQLGNPKNETNKNDEEFKQKVLKIFDQKLNTYHAQTSKNLREVIRKFDQSVKKDCDKKYLPIGFVNDAEIQFLKLEDRIQLLQSKIDGNKKQRSSEDSVILAETFEIRLKQIERQIQQFKKTIVQIQQTNKNLGQSCSSLKSRQNEEEEVLKLKIEELKKSITDNQKQIKSVNFSVESVTKQQQQLSRKLKTVQQNVSKEPKWNNKLQSNQSSDVKQYLNSSKGLATSVVYEGFNGTTKQQLFKTPYQDTPSSQQSTRNSDEMCYRIDKQNYLLDENGNYILNQQNKQIQLTEQQIGLLRKSTLVKLCE